MMEFIKILTAIPIIQVVISETLKLFTNFFGIDKSYYLSGFLQQIIAIFIPTYYFYELRGNNTYLKKPDFKIDNYLSIILFAIFGISLQLTAAFVNIPVVNFFRMLGFKSYMDIPIKNAFDFFSAVISACLFPAVFEEVLFRKFVYNDLRIYSKKTAVIFSAVFFACSHMSFYSFGAMLFIGLLLGMLRAKEYSLIHLIVCHFFLNFSGVIISMVSDTYFFNKFYYILTAASIAAAVYIFKLLLNKPEQLEFNYYEKPVLKFLRVVSEIPYIYIYMVIFIAAGIMNL